MPFAIGHIPKIKGRDSRTIISCGECRTEFKTYKRDRKYCSHTCKGKAWWKSQTKESQNLNIERMVKSENRAEKIKARFKALYRGHTQINKIDRVARNKYENAHQWIRREGGQPNICSKCGRKGLTGHKIHWANLSNDYKKELNDWIRLCVPCHKAFDRIEPKI